jgi:hypothetical protein
VGIRSRAASVANWTRPAAEEPIARDEERVDPLARNRGEGRIDLADGAGAEHMNLQPQRARRFLHSRNVVSVAGVLPD